MTIIHELLDELMSACEMIGYATSGNERASHRATRDKAKAELLSILDAEGDGGAVAWMLDSDGHKTYWPSAEIAAHGQDNLRLLGHASTVTPLYTHPARSGGVSDADVEAACVAYARKASKHIAVSPACMRAALEHFAKGERHE